MKKLIFSLLLILSGTIGWANHITGGTIFYTLSSQSGNNYTYNVTLLLYRDHNSSGAQLDPTASIAIFNRATGAMVWNNTNIPLADTTHQNLSSPDPCINNPPTIWYDVGRYTFSVTLPGLAEGYVIAYQRCCRIAGINNLLNSSALGATYTAQVPGTSVNATYPNNNSARFTGKDTVVVCADNSFCYDFGATDPDGDSLAYYFSAAFAGGTSTNPAPSPPGGPVPGSDGNYPAVSYTTPFSELSPLGPTVTLNNISGLMCGVAPAPGIYVVTVSVAEYRNGNLIATQRKDLQIKVGDCDLVGVTLPASYPMCDDFTRSFENLSPPNNLIHTWEWTFGDGNISNLQRPTHTYGDTGTYNIKLVVNRGEACVDSALAVANVYPGFFPGFTFAGICATKPTQFLDTTRTAYGLVNSWRWDFGDLASNADTSRIQNPAYAYPTTGTRNIRFIVTSNKGCIDTVFKDITILDKPPLQAMPADTLICNGDNVQLNAVGVGQFSWTGPNIANGNTATPTVSPTTTSDYTVELSDNGCINTATVRVNVIDFVTLQAMPDTTICATDSLRLRAATDGLRFNWTPAATLNDPTLLNPSALPVTTTTYQITSTVGSCSTTDQVTVSLVPYPVADAGSDASICYESSTQLNAGITGSAFTWTPSSSLNNPNILNPIASPLTTTNYVLTVTDILGCPKPGRDTVTVVVLPKVNAFAGNDTLVVVGQPVQFNASGGISYFWSPATNLSSVNIANPQATYDGSFDSIRYKVVIANELGCADSAFMTVRIFNTNPQVFVPTAFTPNGDGKNDIFRPIAVGIQKFDYFRVYNRWGQLVYSTTNTEYGWDGRIGGKDQSSNTFVWIVKGTDFTGKSFFAKGTVILIR
ncbi:MAG: PKD domain-containing protein [Flavisolibacter sp.]